MNTILCLFFVSIILVSAQLEIRDPCGENNDKICVLVQGCPEAVDLIKRREIEKLVICGWQNTTQIVCCKREESKLSVERKAVEECKNYDVNIGPFIIGGQNVSVGEYPHMAALGYESDNASSPYDFKCGGSLISENYVLTAAHCLAIRIPLIVIRLGKVDLLGNADNTEAQDIRIGKENLIAHPKYKHFERQNDIALIRLSTPAKLTVFVQPICLYTDENTPDSLSISGWGHTVRGGTIARFLQQALVTSVDGDRCNDTFLNSPFPRAILPSQLCAIGNGENVSDTCQGDSGGPIQTTSKKSYGTEFMVVGITSYGSGCATKLPGIYTRVSSYLDWIESVVWPD